VNGDTTGISNRIRKAATMAEYDNATRHVCSVTHGEHPHPDAKSEDLAARKKKKETTPIPSATRPHINGQHTRHGHKNAASQENRRWTTVTSVMSSSTKIRRTAVMWLHRVDEKRRKRAQRAVVLKKRESGCQPDPKEVNVEEP